MPEEQKPTEGFPDVAASNAAVTAQLENQGRPGVSNEADLRYTGDALDDLARSIVESKKPAEEKDEPEVVPEKPAVETPPVTEPTPEEKAKADEAAAHAKRADELFKDSPGLPPGASPKSTESFSRIKIRAAQEIAARDTQLEEYKTKLADAEAKLQNAVPPEVVKELEDHRQWRAKLDVEADPKFKQFDQTVNSAQEFIYAQLRKSPAITDDVIAKIKANGGPENVKLEKIFAAVNDPTLQRIVEAKVADIEQAKWSKEQAIKSTKTNITQYLAEREKQNLEGVDSHNTTTKKEFDAIAARFPWHAQLNVDPKADEPTQKAAEAHNTRAKAIQSYVTEMLSDVSPNKRAVMIAATAQAVWLNQELTTVTARTAALEKENAELKEKLGKVKQASVGRFQNGAGAASSKPTEIKQKESDIFEKRAGDALDDLAKSVIEERSRKAVA